MIGDWLIAFIIRTLAMFVCWLPRQSVPILGSGLGYLFYFALAKRRRLALENLQIAFGHDKSADERARICRDSFLNLGKTAIEFLRFPKLNFDNIWENVTVEGKENLIQALDRGKGVIVFIPHFGNWELLALVYGALIPNRAKAIAFPMKNSYLNAWVSKCREHLSLKLILRKQAVRETLRAIKANYAIGFFADQNAGREGVFVDFFGKPVSTVRGPVTLALKTGASLVFSLDVRQPDDRHRVLISPPIDLDISGALERDVQVNTTRILKILEGYIRQYPGQWLWLHNRWKIQPDSKWQMKRQLQRK
ncbi:MAG: lysophospholipid acyltransferase family protein [Candidatus Poribacteria bacterium]|nr:lysophospholipid acyltransferase family protein [Candidatus Poribacteria bacterium]